MVIIETPIRAPTLEKMVMYFTPEQSQETMEEHVIMHQLMVAEQTVLNQLKAGQ